MKKNLIFISLFVLLSSLLNSSSGWNINFIIKVKGSYEIKGEKNPIEGNYYLTIKWKGGIERDDGDYLLLKEDKKVIEWNGKETVYALDNFLSYEEIELSNYSPPELNVNYLLKRKNLVHVDFNFTPLLIPFSELENKRRLLMPCSAQNKFLNPNLKYNNHIIKGSNSVCFKEKELYLKKEFSRKFSWEWKKVQRTFKNNKLITFINYHSVELELKVRPYH